MGRGGDLFRQHTILAAYAEIAASAPEELFPVGGTTPRSLFVAPDLTTPDGAIPLRLVDVQRLRGDTVWLRYEIAR